MRHGTIRGALAAVAFATVVALAGCGGIPTSGSVNVGAPISNNEKVNIAKRPLGPNTDASQEDIMLGFIQAAVSADDDYAVARSYLSQGFNKKWKPNTVTQIRTGAATTSRNSATSLSYSITSSAFVDSTGRYFEAAPATQALSFEFTQGSDKQWRISSAPPGIVLSQDGFDTTFEEHALYYFDPSNNYLVPDMRWFPETTLVSARIVKELLAGQASWLKAGVTHSEFPDGTALNSVTVTSGAATVDLTEQALSASPGQHGLMQQQLSSSLGVSTVTMTVNGIPIDLSNSGSAKASVNPGVSLALLVRRDASFGYLASDNSIAPIPKLSAAIAKLDPRSVTLSRSKTAAAVLAADGVYGVRGSTTASKPLDKRPALAAPSIDSAGFVWSVPVANPAGLKALEFDGAEHAISAALPDNASVVSFGLSRDSTRAYFLLSTDVGPQLIVYGVIRQGGVPVALGEPYSLRVTVEQPLGATWVDDHTIAMLSQDGSQAAVSVYDIGGERTSNGRVADGVAIVGGNGATEGLRVVTSAGEIFRPRGTGWQDTGTKVGFIATQQ